VTHHTHKQREVALATMLFNKVHGVLFINLLECQMLHSVPLNTEKCDLILITKSNCFSSPWFCLHW